MDLVLERIELRARRRAPIDRRLIAVDRPADRVAMQPGPPMDLPHRQAAHEVQPPDLRPLLHPDHLGPPELALRKRAQDPQATGHRSGGPLFNRRRWPSFHPAPTPSELLSLGIPRITALRLAVAVTRRAKTAQCAATTRGCRVSRWPEPARVSREGLVSSGARECAEQAAQAAASAWRCSFSRLWVAVISRHSVRTAALPRRWKRSMPRLNLVLAEDRLDHLLALAVELAAALGRPRRGA